VEIGFSGKILISREVHVVVPVGGREKKSSEVRSVPFWVVAFGVVDDVGHLLSVPSAPLRAFAHRTTFLKRCFAS